MKNFNKHIVVWGLVAAGVAVIGYRKRKALNAVKHSNDIQETESRKKQSVL